MTSSNVMEKSVLGIVRQRHILRVLMLMTCCQINAFYRNNLDGQLTKQWTKTFDHEAALNLHLRLSFYDITMGGRKAKKKDEKSAEKTPFNSLRMVSLSECPRTDQRRLSVPVLLTPGNSSG
ncbi:hypothetical protein OUZ56_007859 [Daphnia magna]|uniref:Uncharacterized protein n=1 Tax=Daphnia magna TaxID=35525 RepID=A0ABR0ABI9_9CRUS|nr:hypothetical protein OUZ56_007859 [Daphnia magna]